MTEKIWPALSAKKARDNLNDFVLFLKQSFACLKNSYWKMSRWVDTLVGIQRV